MRSQAIGTVVETNSTKLGFTAFTHGFQMHRETAAPPKCPTTPRGWEAKLRIGWLSPELRGPLTKAALSRAGQGGAGDP
jgi:hypothetical protein